MARFAAAKGTAIFRKAKEKAKMFANGVQAQLPGRCQKPMPMQNDHSPAIFLCKLFHALAQFQFFAGEHFFAEATNLSEYLGVAKNK